MQSQLIATTTTTDEPTGATPVDVTDTVAPSTSAPRYAVPTIPVGVQVELRSRFDDRWTHGFAIAVCGDGEYQVRRLSDGCVLPAWFPAEMLRPILES
jgi:hypothetical protein